jgi:hypothetical protein
MYQFITKWSEFILNKTLKTHNIVYVISSSINSILKE